MSKLNIEINDYNLAPTFARQIMVGSAFAFVAPDAAQNPLQSGLNNFYGIPATVRRQVLPLLPEGVLFPGFQVKLTDRPFKLAPVLLPDKEIYRAGKDSVRLLLVAPAWLFGGGQTAQLVIENNGTTYRKQAVNLENGGLTLVELGQLPEGGYRVYWDDAAASDYKGEKAECKFSIVEYVLAPLQATLLAHELNEKRLACRLKVESYNEPLNQPVLIELWSGNTRHEQEKVKPAMPGVYNVEFKVKAKANERLELRVSYFDNMATAVIPGSSKAERDETRLSGLGREVTASMMPGATTRAVRGLYLSYSGAVTNTPVMMVDPAPPNRKTRVRWQVAAESARLLVLDMHNAIVADKNLGDVVAGQEFEIEVPAPGGFLAVGGWIGDKAWEGWAVLLAPAEGKLEIIAPPTARPGQQTEIKLATDGAASVYVLVRDSRLAGASPGEKLASTLKRGLQGTNDWGFLGYVTGTLDNNSDWPRPQYAGFGGPPSGGFAIYRGEPILPPMAMPRVSAPMGQLGGGRPMMQASAMSARVGGMMNEIVLNSFDADLPTSLDETASLKKQSASDNGSDKPRRDFADLAYCGLVQTDANGQATINFKLPEAVTTYTIEAFAMSQKGTEWTAARESLEVSQPVWAELKLPAFVYPGDKTPATLDIGCIGGQFSLRLLCDDVPVTYKLSGAKQISTDTFAGQRAKVLFEAQPGKWRVELEDLTTHEHDSVERTVEAIGQFKALARRFQLVMAGQTVSRAMPGVVQMRVLPSLDQPFKLLCDATTSYSHKCCEQTAAKLIAAVAALMAGGEQVKLRDVIVAGVAREKRMYLPGRGFMMYPPDESGGNNTPNEYWGKLAAEYLAGLAILSQVFATPDAAPLDPTIKTALSEAVTMGQDAAKAYKLKLVPEQIADGRDAYRAVVASADLKAKALSYARESLQKALQSNTTAYGGAVMARQEIAYCAATLLLGGEQANFGLAVEATNKLASNINEEGRLYSTVDSVALVNLLVALRRAGIGVGGKAGARLQVDNREVTLAEAIEISAGGQVSEVTVLEGAALVELTSEVTEDWSAFRAELPVSLQMLRPGKLNLRGWRLGDSVDLVVKIQQYEPGLLVHVCLPQALSKIEGGGEVKKFSVDFCGRNEVRIPLRASGYTLPAGEHWAVLVRNMFKEEQAGSPGLQLAQVAAD